MERPLIPQREVKGPNTGDYEFYWYIAAWVDLLGQSEKLDQLDELPTTEAQKREFVQRAQRTFGAVRSFRDRMAELHAILARPLSLPAGMLVTLNKDDLRLFKKYSSPEVKISFLSDSALLTVCLRENAGWSPLLSVDFMLSQLAIIALTMVAQGTPIRGGMAAGICSVLREGDLYGKAVSRANQLEKAAGYPRIVVDDSLLEYVAWCEHQPATGREQQLRAHHVQAIKSAFRADADGQKILSYLGERFKREYGHETHFPEIVALASTFVAGEIERFRRSGNEKLLERYQKLKAYFEQEDCWKPSASSSMDK